MVCSSGLAGAGAWPLTAVATIVSWTEKTRRSAMTGKMMLSWSASAARSTRFSCLSRRCTPSGVALTSFCPDKKAGDAIKTSLHDFAGDQTYTEKPGPPVHARPDLRPGKAARNRRGVRGGGTRPEYIRIDNARSGHCRHFHETGKPIFTICPRACRPSITVDGVVKGKRVAALEYASPRCGSRRDLTSTSSRPAPASTAISYPPRAGRPSRPLCANA